jgi:hypothetical protein
MAVVGIAGSVYMLVWGEPGDKVAGFLLLIACVAVLVFR